MRITSIADTHNQHNKLVIEETDCLIHAGDFTLDGNVEEVIYFLEWFKDQPAKHKIFIAGNHEATLDEDHPMFNLSLKTVVSNLARQYGIFYLENTGILIEGIHIYGTPWTPAFHHFGFGGERDIYVEGDKYRGTRLLSSVYNQIPTNTNILICHGPPKDIQDVSRKGISCGSDEMIRTVHNLPNLKVFVNGHIHHSAGTKVVQNVLYINAAVLDDSYTLKFPPIVIDYKNDSI